MPGLPSTHRGQGPAPLPILSGHYRAGGPPPIPLPTPKQSINLESLAGRGEPNAWVLIPTLSLYPTCCPLPHEPGQMAFPSPLHLQPSPWPGPQLAPNMNYFQQQNNGKGDLPIGFSPCAYVPQATLTITLWGRATSHRGGMLRLGHAMHQARIYTQVNLMLSQVLDSAHESQGMPRTHSPYLPSALLAHSILLALCP